MAPLLLKVLFCFSFYLYVGGYEWCSRGCWAELRIKENPPEPNIKMRSIFEQDFQYYQISRWTQYLRKYHREATFNICAEFQFVNQLIIKYQRESNLSQISRRTQYLCKYLGKSTINNCAKFPICQLYN